MNWKILMTNGDVREFNAMFGNFHDSCLKEMSYATGGYVSTDLEMNVESLPIARYLFQRQMKEPSVVELEFREILQMNIVPVGNDEGVDIIHTHLYFEDGIFFLSEKDYEFEERKSDSTWIAAKYARWRVRDDLLGEDMVYMKDF